MNSMMTSQEIEASITRKVQEMDENTKNGNYVEAENCRVTIDKLKKDYEAKVLQEMEQQHSKDTKDFAEMHEKEMQNFNSAWEKKFKEIQDEEEKTGKQMAERHDKEMKNLRQDLEKQLPTKVKESSELLNLRKKEENMAKQKKFVEAHEVQETIAHLEKEEKEIWMKNRLQKMDVAIHKLRNKQDGQLAAFQKRFNTIMNEQTKIRGIEEGKLKLKFANSCKEMKMQQEKDLIARKGQFRSKGGVSGSPNMTKSRFRN